MDKIDRTFVNNLVFEIINKYERAVDSKMRCVLVRNNLCYCCNKNCETNFLHYLTPLCAEGLLNKMGWIICDDCLPLVEMANKYEECHQSYLYFDKYKFLDKTPIQFWRKSSTEFIKSYLQKDARVFLYERNSIHIYNDSGNKRINVVVNWKNKEDNPLQKGIPLANIICCNRNIFGYSIDDCPILKIKDDVISNSIWEQEWIPLLSNEYNVANMWYNALLCIKRNNLSMIDDVKDVIFTKWANIQLCY